MARKKAWYSNITPTQQLGLAIALFAAATLLSRDAAVSTWEQHAFDAIYGLPSWLHGFFYVITQFGSIYVLIALVLFYLGRKHYHIVIRLLMTGTFAYLLAGFGKSILGRGRPDQLLPNIITLDFAQGPGFPSGHVALAVALALTIGHYLPRKYHWIPVVWIIGVAISRIYLGVHLPLDIIGGFAVGWIAYALFRHVRIYDLAKR